MNDDWVAALQPRTFVQRAGDPDADSVALRRVLPLWAAMFPVGLWVCDAITCVTPRVEGIALVLLMLAVGAMAAGGLCLYPAPRPVARAVRCGVVIAACVAAVATLERAGLPPWLVMWLLPAGGLLLLSAIVDGTPRLPSRAAARRLYGGVLAATMMAAAVVAWRAAPLRLPGVERHAFPNVGGSLSGSVWRAHERPSSNPYFGNTFFTASRGPIRLTHGSSLRVEHREAGAADIPSSTSDPVVVWVEPGGSLFAVEGGGFAVLHTTQRRAWRSLLSCPMDAAPGLILATLLALALVHRIRRAGTSARDAEASTRADLPHRTPGAPRTEDDARAQEFGARGEAWSLLTSIVVACPLWTEALLGC
ncbi:MAG: hypothetical protein U0325_15840 [Polyangiales bacterium]